MKIKYVNDCQDVEFTLNKVYEGNVTMDGLQIIDDIGNEHVIATTDNEFKSYYGDDFFRSRFIIL
jgi:hypothetical protein